MSRTNSYTRALKQSDHHLIDSILERMRRQYAPKFVGEDKERHLEDFLFGYEIALRALANANGSLSDRLKSLLFLKV